jgi:hypothetical protein
VHRAKSDLLVLLIHEEKYFSPKSLLELLFSKQLRPNLSKKASSLAHHASNNKSKIVAHPTNHGKAHFGPTQHPTNNTAALV